MKTQTLGWRLGLSFGALVLLMAVLGGVAVWRINLAATSATEVATKFVEKIDSAHGLNESTWQTMYSLRGYGLSGDAYFLRNGRKALADVKEGMKKADDLVKRFPDLVNLGQVAAEAHERMADYEALLDRTELARTSLNQQRAAMDAAAAIYMQQSDELLGAERQQFSSEAESTPDAAKMKEKIAKLGLAEDLVALGMTIQINNFKAQSTEDTDGMRSALKDFGPLEGTAVSLSQLLVQDKNIEHLRKIREAADAYKSAMEKVLAATLAIQKLHKEQADTGAAVQSLAHAMVEEGLSTVKTTTARNAAALYETSVILVVGLAIALIVGVVVAWLSTRAITVPIRQGVNALASTASEISATIAELASNASEAAAAVAETTTTVDEIRQTSQLAADRAKSVADGAQGASRAADTGRQATEQTVQGLNVIREQMSSIGESITRLSEQSQAVGDIVSTVTDLAEQSNLLAVNASIEAAKAGDQGKGFAVVAQEIRSLAEQSKDSTKQVRGILTEVQKATGRAVLAAEQGSGGVAAGVQQADRAGQAIGTLTASVQEAAQASIQIAASSQQQLAGMEQVGRAMENIKQATAQNAEGARQLAAAAHNLQEIGGRLKALVDADGNMAFALAST